MRTDEACIFVRRVVGANAGRLRAERNISQSELARMVEVNRSHVNQFEAGKQNISIDYLVKLADGLDVPISDFFGGLESDAPHRLYRADTI